MPAANDDKTEKTKKGRGVDTNTGSRYKSAPTFIPVDLDKKPDSLMKYALRTSLGTGVSIDTKFYAYSRRKASQPGTMFAPRAVYANSLMLRARLPSYFDPHAYPFSLVSFATLIFAFQIFEMKVLGGWYGKNVVEGSLDAPFPEDFADETEKYDYDSDSDIENDDEADTVLSKSPETSLTKAADANKVRGWSDPINTVPANIPSISVGIRRRSCQCTVRYKWKDLANAKPRVLYVS